MKTLIAYMSTHGCTEKTAIEIKEKLGDNVTLVNLKKDKIPLITEFDQVIIGGSIHAGQIQKRVKEFCSKNLDILITRDLGLYICCMEEGEKGYEQFQNAFPDELINHAKSTAVLGGEFDFNRMNFIEKLVIKKVAKVNESVSKINHNSIDKFVENMQKIFNPFLFLA
ncbi:MAG: flavodoxin domain-containing protein [Prolixibacteraceae bacterium]|nr:flavodoxin domain-containing protein [Prolixibacteraceae bacterium]